MSCAVVDRLLLGGFVRAHDAGPVVDEGVVDWRFVGMVRQRKKLVEVHDGFRSRGGGFGCEGCLQ
jgi:hypothetical protein